MLKKISGFVVGQFEIKSLKDICWLFPKILLAGFILHELYYDCLYLKCLYINYPPMLLPPLAKRFILAVLVYLVIKFVWKKKKIKPFVIVLFFFQIFLSIFAGWFYGGSGWLRCGLGGIFYVNGPYVGKVTDADTGTPVSEVIVAGVWEFECMVFVVELGCYADARETQTDSKGRFILAPARRFFFWPFSVITLSDFKIFKPGYETVSSKPKYPFKTIHVKLKKVQTMEERWKAILEAGEIRSDTDDCDWNKIKNASGIYIEEKKRLRKMK